MKPSRTVESVVKELVDGLRDGSIVLEKEEDPKLPELREVVQELQKVAEHVTSGLLYPPQARSLILAIESYEGALRKIASGSCSLDECRRLAWSSLQYANPTADG